MSDDLVKRYDLEQPTHHMGSAELVCDTYGDWVLYRDYKALADRIEELEANLAKAVEALDWIGNHMVMSMALNESGLITSMKQHARTTLAAVSETHKLKGDTND